MDAPFRGARWQCACRIVLVGVAAGNDEAGAIVLEIKVLERFHEIFLGVDLDGRESRRIIGDRGVGTGSWIAAIAVLSAARMLRGPAHRGDADLGKRCSRNAPRENFRPTGNV